MKHAPFVLTLALLALIAACATSGCISITNNVYQGNAPASGADAAATMSRAAPTNSLAADAVGTVAINSAIYSHKTISPDTTATLTK